MFQFMKANKMFTATVAVMIILLVAIFTGFATQHPVLSLTFTGVSVVASFIGFYNQVMNPRSE